MTDTYDAGSVESPAPLSMGSDSNPVANSSIAPVPPVPPVASAPPVSSAPIRAQSADGVIHEFAAGTPQEAVDLTMKQYAADHQNRSTTLGQMATGFMDPLEGGGQLVAHALPKDATRTLDAVNNWISDKTGLLRKLPEGGKDQQIKDREKEIDKLRGHSKDIDWARTGGSMLNPVNYIGGFAVRAPGAIAAAANGLVGGTFGGAIQPAAGDDFMSEKAVQTGLGAGLGAGIGAAGAGIGKVIQKAGEYVAAKYPDNIATQAVQTVLRRMGQDQKAGGMSATDAIDLINAAKKPLTLADVGGENTLGLAGNVARQQGESRAVAKNFLTERDQGAAERLSQDISRTLSGGDETVHQATEALLQARSAAARPAYDAAHDLKNIWSPRLDEFFADPTIKAGLERGFNLERIVALAEGRPITASQLGVDLTTSGEPKLLEKPNMRLLDMAKQGLDAIVADSRDPITGRLSKEGFAIDKLRKAYVGELDKLDTTGAYRKARESWGGYSANIEALRLGRTSLNRSPEENAAIIGGFRSEADKEFYRLGQADLLKERLAKTGFAGDEAKAIIKNPWMRDQLKPAFKTDAEFNAFVDAVTAENSMFKTANSVLGGSPTAARMAEDAGGTGDRLAQGGKIVAKLMGGHFLSAAKTAWQFYRDIGLRPNPELNEKTAKILFSTHFDPADPVTQQLTGRAAAKLRNPVGDAPEGVYAAAKGASGGAGAGAGESMDEPYRGKKP